PRRRRGRRQVRSEVRRRRADAHAAQEDHGRGEEGHGAVSNMPAAPAQRPDSPVLRIRSLSKTYGEGETAVQALRGVDLDVRAGEFVVLLGASGSGKSTLLNILGGLDRPSSGEVEFYDHRLTDASDDELTRYRREHVGFVFQFYNLIPSLTLC